LEITNSEFGDLEIWRFGDLDLEICDLLIWRIAAQSRSGKNHQITKSPNHQITKSPNLQITKSPNLQINKSSNRPNLQISKSPNLQFQAAAHG
jgi:hypothetical protein